MYEELARLGFTQNEAKLYIILLQEHEAHAGLISKKAQINRTTTYDALERLIKKGLVKYVLTANRKLFKPEPPQRILDMIKEQEKTAKKIMLELNKIYQTKKTQEDSSIYRGTKGIKSILNDVLNYKSYLAFGSAGKFMEIMKHDFVNFQKRKKELGIKSKVIEPITAKRHKEFRKAAHASLRYIEEKYATPTTTIVYGNKTAIIVWSDVPTATVITGKEVSQSYKNYFELLWKIAKP